MSKIRVLYLITLLSISGLTRSQKAQTQLRPDVSGSAPRMESVETTDMPLQLVTDTLKQTYCEGPDPDLLTLRLLLRLTFLNIGKQRMILERGSKQVPVVRISKTPEDAIAARLEMSFDNYIITGKNNPSKLTKRPTPSRFVILQPGESYKSIADIDIPIPRGRSVSASVDPGNHYLQIGVWTWDGPQSEAKVKRTAWYDDGFLWSKPVLSKPMRFTVSSQPKPADCQCDKPGIGESQAIDIATRRMNELKRASGPYRPLAMAQGCEWQVVFESKLKRPNQPSFIFIVDKSNGTILEEFQ